MKLNKFTVVLAILLVSILAIGAVSAESVDDSGIVAVTDGDIQESVDVTDTVDDLSTANNADEIVNDDGGAAIDEGTNSYDLDDDTYSKYFNDDGTAKEVINESSDYTLNVGTLTNKDIIINYGSHINIVGKDGAGFINNGSIIIGGSEDGVSSVMISNLKFITTNAAAINILDGSKDLTVNGCQFDITGNTQESENPMLSVYAISANGDLDDLEFINNEIQVQGDATYSYGIQVGCYIESIPALANPRNIRIANNKIEIIADGVVEALYLDSVVNAVVEGNNVTVKTIGNHTAYGIQVGDAAQYAYYDEDYKGALTSPKDILIKGNNFDIISDFMVYGITVQSFGVDGFWEDMLDYMALPQSYQFDLNTTIIDNTVVANSKRGVIGIGGVIYNMTVMNNNVIAVGTSAENMDTGDPSFNNHTSALYVHYNAAQADDDYFISVIDNNVITNVIGEELLNNICPEYVTFENQIKNLTDGEGRFIVNENTYNLFFDENGYPIGVLTPGSTILLNGLSNKKFNINIPLTIDRYAGDEYLPTNPTLTNCVINLLEGADQTTIRNLIMENDGANADYTSIIKVNALNDIKIIENNINAENFAGNIYGIEVAMVNGIGCDNLVIANNEIYVKGSRYVYGIDIWGYNGNHTYVRIAENTVHAIGSQKMAEAIYLNYIDKFLMDSNILYASNDAASAYGIGADNIFNGVIGNFNVIDSFSKAMAYGITLTNSNNVTITNNPNIRVSGVGAIAIGLAKTNDVTVSANKIKAEGADYLSVSSGDYLIGKGNEAIYNKSENVNLIISDNDITTNFPVFIDNDNYATYFNENGTIKEDLDITYISLNNLTGKNIVVDRQLTITGSAVDTTITVLPDGSGTNIKNLKMEATVSSGSFALIHIKEAQGVLIDSCTLDITCNNDLSTWDMIMPIQVEGGATGCEGIFIENNNITVTGTAPYVYGIDAYKQWNSENYLNYIMITGNIITLYADSQMSEGIYASGLKESAIAKNTIVSRSTNSAYGIGADNLDHVSIEDNTIIANADGMAYGITATMAGKDVNIEGNKIDATGTGAMGIGFTGQDNISIASNEVNSDGGDYTTLEPKDALGVGNAAIFDGGQNTNVNIGENRADEYSSVNLEAADLTVTAATSGQGSYEVTVKTLDGKALANKEITFSFNNQVIKATTDANGIAKLSFDLNKAGKYPVSVAFLGDKHYRGAFATATITINPIKTSLTSAAKTYLATAKTKSLTATLKDANGNVLANKKVTFTVNGKTVTATTNAKGVATAKLALTAAKTYTVTIKFAGDDVYAASTVSAKVKLNKEKTKVTAPKKTFKKSKKVKKVVIKLKNSKGKAIAKKKVTLTVNKKKYTAKTNKKGKATFKVKNLKKKGTFKYKVKFAGDTQYKASKKTGKIKVK